jgi:hypothetical protein
MVATEREGGWERFKIEGGGRAVGLAGGEREVTLRHDPPTHPHHTNTPTHTEGQLTQPGATTAAVANSIRGESVHRGEILQTRG